MSKKSIKKILIANRGEIAVRVIRTCREMDIRTVAVYSEVDRLSPHVLMADEAYHIGPALASESYLNINKLFEVAKTSGADAIHPGYGFLAENSHFARKVADNGLIFIGPLPETIRLMGNKTESRQAMIDAGVPVVPGTKKSIETVDEVHKIIDDLGGYPILIKAAAGGGGKGMRVVKDPNDLGRALQAAKGEAEKAFGDATVYIEKFVESPKHIEIQIIADQHGNTIHLWERDCSIQRRHQKVIEECPSSVLTPEKREEMASIAVQAASACNYVNAGTVEFLFDTEGNFYFLEMNTRLQVEHPVTEMVMGVDLVKMQIQVAQGEPLPLKQEDLSPRGHAIECRINAEDVFNDFVPSIGKINYLKHPEGAGIRVDSGVDNFVEISRHYDPLVTKLIAWAETRKEAIQRMKRALYEYHIEGVKVTIPFCLAVLNQSEFVKGTFSTKFVELYWDKLQQEQEAADVIDVIAAAIAYHRDMKKQHQITPTEKNGSLNQISPWKIRALNEMTRMK